VSLIFITGLLLLIVLTQLIRWQFVHAAKLTNMAVQQRSLKAPLSPARGDIFDRNGNLLTNKTNMLALVVYPKLLRNLETTFNLLQTTLKENFPFKTVKEFSKLNYYVKEIQVHHVSDLEKIEDDGLAIVSYPRRYRGDGFASHLLGYINAADNRGEAGVELVFDRILKCEQPKYFLEAMLDGKGNLIRGTKYRLSKSNEQASQIYLTIDSRIQEIVENAANRYITKGAIVVSDPRTGEILGLVSRPTFVADRLEDYLSKPNSPFTNRALSPYAPGSVYKIVVAAAALEENLVSPDEVFHCPGYYELGEQRIKCHSYEDGGHGDITFFDAMVYSCNTVFIEVGQRLGMKKLREYSERFGLGSITELNFPGEKPGNIPRDKYYSPGDLANISIGQGGLTATPVQLLSVLNVIINDGMYKPLSYLYSIQKPGDDHVQPVMVLPGRQIISQITAKSIQKMLEGVTVYGTGKQANLSYLRSAGKTGTAETGIIGVNQVGISHAWFAGYFPAEDPKYSIIVFVEGGMSGSNVAAPIFRRIMEEISINLD